MAASSSCGTASATCRKKPSRRFARAYFESRARDAAVASLGTLRASLLLPLLRGFFEDRDLGWRTRCLAAKSIGDIGTKEALD